MTAALKAATTGKAPTTSIKQKSVIDLLSDPAIKAQISLALPKHLTADRMTRIIMTEVRKTPALAKCDQASFMAAVMQASQLGLEPGSALGHCYLLPFENRKAGRTECQFILGWRGMIELARRSGNIKSIESRPVYEGDVFEVEFGLDSKLRHVPNWNGKRDFLAFTYAVAKLSDGGVQFEVMSRKEIERVRASSKSADRGPWASHFEEMAKKTVVRRLFKYLPISAELANTLTRDDANEKIIEAEGVIPVIDHDTGEVGQQPVAQIENEPSETVEMPAVSDVARDFFKEADHLAPAEGGQ